MTLDMRPEAINLRAAKESFIQSDQEVGRLEKLNQDPSAALRARRICYARWLLAVRSFRSCPPADTAKL